MIVLNRRSVHYGRLAHQLQAGVGSSCEAAEMTGESFFQPQNQQQELLNSSDVPVTTTITTSGCSRKRIFLSSDMQRAKKTHSCGMHARTRCNENFQDSLFLFYSEPNRTFFVELVIKYMRQ